MFGMVFVWFLWAFLWGFMGRRKFEVESKSLSKESESWKRRGRLKAGCFWKILG